MRFKELKAAIVRKRNEKRKFKLDGKAEVTVENIKLLWMSVYILRSSVIYRVSGKFLVVRIAGKKENDNESREGRMKDCLRELTLFS